MDDLALNIVAGIENVGAASRVMSALSVVFANKMNRYLGMLYTGLSHALT